MQFVSSFTYNNGIAIRLLSRFTLHKRSFLDSTMCSVLTLASHADVLRLVTRWGGTSDQPKNVYVGGYRRLTKENS